MSVRREDLGDPIATGRSAEIFAWPDGDGLVLKLFPAEYGHALVAAEVTASVEAARLGLTPIGCHGQVRVGDQPGLVLDRLHGDSLTRQAERNPLLLRAGSRTLARTHVRLHEATTTVLPEIREVATAALDTGPLAFLSSDQRARAASLIADLPAGDRVLHLDFHTENVFAHDGGVAVIDWQTALRGDPAADVAMTVLLIRDAELWPGTPFLKRVMVQAVRRVVLATYLTEYQRLTGMTTGQIAAWRVPAVVLRMSTLDIASERPRLGRELTALLGGDASAPYTIQRFVEGASPVTSVDVLVVGGGITGAAVAYEAAVRGLRVALVEERDFGGATSAATGKLLHGGLRYLKQLEIGLVRESLRERRILSNIAPNLVDAYPIVLSDAGLVVRAGLTAYDVLSFDRNRVVDPAKRIPRHHRLAGGGVRYHDCLMISPERLTLAFVRSAAVAGALVANHTRAEELLTEGRTVVGARVTDLLSGTSHQVRARVVVNATGPWVFDTLADAPLTRGAAGPTPSVRSEGIYLITRQLTDVMTLHVTPHGHFSCAPWRGMSMIGPTEKPYRGAVSDWRLTRESVEEFLAVINETGMLPVPIGLTDVVHAYGGLRPLTEDVGDDTYRASRGFEVIDHADAVHGGIEGLVTAAGGKYTTSRGFAEALLPLVSRKLGRSPGGSRTRSAPLHGCGTGPIEAYVAASVARNSDFSPGTVRYLARHHGTEHDAVLDLARAAPQWGRSLDADGELLAQAVVAARHESARTLTDVLLRRTDLGTLGHPGDEVLEAVAGVVATELGWDDSRREAELAEAHAALTLPW